ncbi:MAG: hypothetical protein AAFX06_01025 [Planctomycetota bacterium]
MMNADRPGSSDALMDRWMRVDVFKHAIANQFAIELRTATWTQRSHDGQTRTHRFHYLAEIDSLLAPRVSRLPVAERRAFRDVFERAQDAFWSLYLDFLPLVNSVSASSGVESESLERVLARAILLYDVARKTRFVTYLEKTLRESVKNLRGQRYADELALPVSAGRLVPQLMWELHQAAMRTGHALSAEESDRVVIGFLRQHQCRFSDSCMQRIARTLREETHWISLDSCFESLEPSATRDGTRAGNDCYVDQEDERQHQLSQIERAMERAGFSEEECALTYARLDLPYNHILHERVASKVTSATLRKRKTRLLVRLMSARYADQAPRFGPFLNTSPAKARAPMREKLVEISRANDCQWRDAVDDLLNWMSLSESVYRISILERGRLMTFLCDETRLELSSPLFQKLKAALIEQDRLDFPCIRSPRENVSSRC